MTYTEQSRRMMLLAVLLVFVPGILCQRIPLRFDLAIDRLRQYQHFVLDEILNDIPYTTTPAYMSDYLLSLSKNDTTTCENEFVRIIEAALEREMWALGVLDSWGKPLPSGLLTGNLYWTGNYDECLQEMYTPTNKTFVKKPINTQYCTLLPQPLAEEQVANKITLGLCMPASCDRPSIALLIRSFFKKSNTTQDNLRCSNDPPNGQKGLTRGAIATCVILSVLGFLVFIGTVVDLILTSRLDSAGDIASHINGYNRMSDDGVTDSKLMSFPPYSHFSLHTLLDTSPRTVFIAEFSALRTLRRIFTMKKKEDENSFFPFINGLRVLALFWVIIGHSFLFGIFFTNNILDVLVWTRNIAFQLLSSGTLSVDTFFVLSGFLTAVLFVRQVNKVGKLSFSLMGLYYIHRYVRLTPTFLLVMLVSIHLSAYFGHGPMYPSQHGFETEECHSSTWWAAIVYVGNLVKPDKMCLPVAWYLHNDMQFHWIAPLALIPFVMRRKSIAYLITIIFILVGIGSTFGILLYYPNMQTSAIQAIVPAAGPTFFNRIYVAPWCRISAYAVGVLTGFIVINTDRSYRTNTVVKALGTIVMTLIALACIFAFYPDNILVPGVSRGVFLAYQSLSRTGWSAAIGWLLFLCSTNQGGIVNTILSWPIWSPLARLNYAAYLIHMMVLFITILNQTMPIYYQPLLVVNNFVSHIFFSYIAATIVVIFFETPFVVLEKKLFKR